LFFVGAPKKSSDLLGWFVVMPKKSSDFLG